MIRGVGYTCIGQGLGQRGVAHDVGFVSVPLCTCVCSVSFDVHAWQL